MTNQMGERVHERTWGLLPWYVNGTLSAAEQQLVETHVGSCPRCQEELEHCRTMSATLLAAEDSAPSPHPVQLARLLEKIEALEAPAAQRSLRGARWFGPQQPLRWVVAAQLVLLLGLGAMFLHRPAVTRSGGRYVTLSQRQEIPHGAELRMVFADAATAGQIRDLLLRVGGHVTDGPSPVGAYTVQIVPGANHKDPLDLVVAYLRAQPIVRFAQPVAGSTEPAR
jgi:hypothetical protein